MFYGFKYPRAPLNKLVGSLKDEEPNTLFTVVWQQWVVNSNNTEQQFIVTYIKIISCWKLKNQNPNFTGGVFLNPLKPPPYAPNRTFI